ncbi:DUF503 domain-containing protein [Desulfallas thermosapovorans]|uniref:DUF503 domain-containing protein n=1 Tax=Desulfallas thermosapovorans DSM 6562 TaxID=1121431 RepID=A0A5S4ZQ93_9FIRM|nr:DUF503 domain-containing protein [Desulfallas thermosapovorans]TYO94764.1 hypothetical protein LX24_02233 [Desulfallas thermosapovorans DSM 6562]
MVVGVLTLELLLAGSDSLKDKRKVLKSLLERLKHRFNVSVAEVGRQDNRRYSTVGISAVSGDIAHIQSVLDTVVRFIENHNGVEVISMERELL